MNFTIPIEAPLSELDMQVSEKDNHVFIPSRKLKVKSNNKETAIN
ncbi:MAG: hypothetical protein R3294_15475 [Arenibacter troitsensis]|nr:hypothetical protein [Arenibacter troitsensis]